jgi:hypothetical protein
MTADSNPIPNPLAEALREKYGERLTAILEYIGCQSDGPSGLAGSDDGRTAMDRECKRVRIKLDAGFCIDITRNIAQQVIDGLERQAGTLEDDAELLRTALASGKFAQ